MDEARVALNAAGSVADPKFIGKVRAIWVRLPMPPSDPWSNAYKDHWFSVYRTLTGHDYDVASEGADFDLEEMTANPFPYFTESYETVSSQLIGIGSVIKAMQLPPKSSILEMGPGWGNTSLALAQMGYRVTTIDIEPKYTALIRARAEKLGVSINALQGEFSSVRNLQTAFDAVLFYESFHHSNDHLALLDAVAKVLRPSGKLVLAGETVNESIPYDWGLNPNGEAIWQIVTNGWFELAFRESYLLRTLRRKGWHTEKIECPQTAAGIVYRCYRG